MDSKHPSFAFYLRRTKVCWGEKKGQPPEENRKWFGNRSIEDALSKSPGKTECFIPRDQ